MVVLGVLFVLIGVALLVAEAHVPAGALGVAGGLSLTVGAAVAITAAGGGAILAIPVALGACAISAAWLLVATRKALAAQSRVPQSLSGHLGTVRRWNGRDGQVFVDGALWRARRSWNDDEDNGMLDAGDQIVVER